MENEEFKTVSVTSHKWLPIEEVGFSLLRSLIQHFIFILWCLYAGQSVEHIKDIPAAGKLVERLWAECLAA